MRRQDKTYRAVFWDIVIIMCSISIAILLTKNHVILALIGKSQELGHIGSFIAGILFTSIFTTPLSFAAISEIIQTQGVLETALWAACGAVVGDLVIFYFIRDIFSEHIKTLLSHQRTFRRIGHIFRSRLSGFLTFLVGGLIIASPLPDELGVGLLGFSRMREIYFIPLSFGFNFLGILFISLLARSAM